MQSTQDMALAFQAQLMANIQKTTARRPADGKTEEGGSFQDLLSQKTQEVTQTPENPGQAAKPDTGEAVETPAQPGGAPEETDPYLLQLMAAAQTVAMAIPVQTVQTAPQGRMEPSQAPMDAATQPVWHQEPPQLKRDVILADQPIQVTASETPEQNQPAAQVTQAPQQSQPAQSGAEPPQPEQQPVQGGAQPERPVQISQSQTRDTGGETSPGTQWGEELSQTVQTAPEQALFRADVETAPIKVGDAPVVDTQAPDMEAQMARQVERLLAKGGDRVELKLSPGNLGTVTVELTRSEDGSLHVALSAVEEKARSVLERHATGLERALAGAGREVQVEVQRGQENQQSQNQQGENQRQAYDREGQQHQQQQRQQQQTGQDFLQQLRLGLIPTEGQAS